jgi:hypothetical protein
MGAYRAGLVLAAPKPEAATPFYAYETIIEQIVDARAVDLEWPWQGACGSRLADHLDRRPPSCVLTPYVDLPLRPPGATILSRVGRSGRGLVDAEKRS